MIRALSVSMRRIQSTSIECDIIDRQVSRQLVEMREVTGEAEQLEQHLEKARHAVSAALNDKHSPGIITPAESRTISQILLGATADAHHHTDHLKALA